MTLSHCNESPEASMIATSQPAFGPLQTRFGPVFPAPPAPVPFATEELRDAMIKPHRSLDVVLADPARLVATLSERTPTIWLALLLAGSSVVCAIPFGLVLGLDRFWHVTVLFFGSQLICLPSLHVFSLFFGCRVTIGQSFVLGTLISSVAALFTLGFAPIAWFLSVTLPEDGSTVAMRVVQALLLTTSLGAGLAHLGRCLAVNHDKRLGPHPWLLVGWAGLLVFITYRMAGTLGLLP
jgi:hypothetical protein